MRTKDMTFHQGQVYQTGTVSLRPPTVEIFQHTKVAEDVREEAYYWLAQARDSETVYYFSVYAEQELVGQILLHDIDQTANEALVAYHLFQQCVRGQGVGTKMLTLLTQYVRTKTDLSRLIIITSRDNKASQRVAEKCGFRYLGTPREDPINGVLYEWTVHTC
ncbi:MAG: hypothetical protein CL610_16280 [Anaerolineaceae bacterium]|nr:hypothetical protein [Anaerolineaceae bacterium]